ncbi:LysM peptidoglycan-binding domain-containing protein [Specibacter cremeus]|uniref:LysM peptidoglycan-binding domain-containing protein n=1 Tax=Specibacter cremeus TaxID=1629051 RepID=UPI000F77707B|nr:LysM peptidoglycan-binding domain-containing protein [Specibacter cremeus]
MTSERPARPGTASTKHLAAVATAALPVVVLSSLALAHPAAAAPVGAHLSPVTLAPGALAKAVAAATTGHVPAAVVAGSVPTTISPIRVTVPASYTVCAGDTVSAIAARHGLDTNAVLRLNKLTPSSIIYPGQRLALTGTATAPAAKPAANAGTPAAAKYTVRAGDTVSAIAARHGLSTNAVLAANHLGATSIIYPGQVLLLGTAAGAAPAAAVTKTPPAAAPSSGTAGTYTIRAGDTLSGIAARYRVGLSALLAANRLSATTIIYPGQKLSIPGAAPSATAPAAPAATAPAAPAKAAGTYRIVPGDTLSGIAARYGVTLAALTAANNLTTNSIIYAGKTLTIPGVAAAATSVTPLPENEKVGNTFLHYTYPDAVVAEANVNKAALLAAPVPSQAQMREMVARTAAQMGVDPSLAMAFAQQESGFNQRAVSPANAIGTMQVIPQAGQWASDLVGRTLNLLNPQDNVTAGVAIIRALLAGSKTEDLAIAGYYQGQYSVSVHGMFADTKAYVANIKALRKQFR